MRKIITISTFLLVIFSCNNAEKKNGQCEIIILKEETLPPVQELKMEKVDLPEDYTMGESVCHIYQDSILIVKKNGDPYPLTHLLTLVNMNTNEKIGEYFTRGLGPDELLSMLTRFSHNYLDILCYTTGKLIPFNIDSAIMHGNNYKPNIICYDKIMFGDWCSMDDTLFLTTNIFHFDCGNDFYNNAQLPEFYWYSKSGIITPEYKESDYKKIKMANDVSGSTISINKNKNRVVCCYKHQPYIKVFDLNMNLLRKITGTESDDGKYAVINENRIYFDLNEGRTDYYYYATCDDDNIFVINSRFHKKKQVEPEIFKLDWNGNIMARYNTNGMQIRTQNYCKNSNTLYLWVNEDGERCLYKAKL